MKLRLLLALVFVTIVLQISAQSNTESFFGKVDYGYNFLLNIPDEYVDSTQSMPLIIFLHGKSLSGKDLNRVKKYGVLDAIIRTKINPHAFVVAPQCPRTESWNPDKIYNVMNWVKENYTIDTNRIYVVGMSLGGYGTFDFAGKYASQISAAMALCGGGKVKYANNLATIPLWIMHGKADRAVPYSQSLEMERAIKNSSDTNYTRASYFAGLDHADMVHVFYMPQMYQWLYQFDKTQTNKTKINNFDITLSDFRKRPIDGEFGAFGKELKAKEEPNYQPPTQTETKVEPSAPKVQSKQAPRIHIVKQGDTLYQLSKKYHTTIEKLCRNNGIKENAILKIGQKIKLD